MIDENFRKEKTVTELLPSIFKHFRRIRTSRVGLKNGQHVYEVGGIKEANVLQMENELEKLLNTRAAPDNQAALKSLWLLEQHNTDSDWKREAIKTIRAALTAKPMKMLVDKERLKKQIEKDKGEPDLCCEVRSPCSAPPGGRRMTAQELHDQKMVNLRMTRSEDDDEK